MATFKDAKDRAWTVAISIATVRRVRDRLDIDLLSKHLPDLLEKVVGDPVHLCDVLFVCVEDEAQAAGITDEEFGRSMAGDALEGGALAFMEALRDFTPNPRDRARVGKVLATLLKAAEALRDQEEAKVEMETARLLEAVTSGEISSSSQDKPESSPGDIPSES